MSPTSYQTAPPRGEVSTSYRSFITGIHAAAEMCHHTISNSLHHLHHRVKCVIRMAPRIGNLTGRMLTPTNVKPPRQTQATFPPPGKHPLHIRKVRPVSNQHQIEAGKILNTEFPREMRHLIPATPKRSHRRWMRPLALMPTRRTKRLHLDLIAQPRSSNTIPKNHLTNGRPTNVPETHKRNTHKPILPRVRANPLTFAAHTEPQKTR